MKWSSKAFFFSQQSWQLKHKRPLCSFSWHVQNVQYREERTIWPSPNFFTTDTKLDLHFNSPNENPSARLSFQVNTQVNFADIFSFFFAARELEYIPILSPGKIFQYAVNGQRENRGGESKYIVLNSIVLLLFSNRFCYLLLPAFLTNYQLLVTLKCRRAKARRLPKFLQNNQSVVILHFDASMCIFSLYTKCTTCHKSWPYSLEPSSTRLKGSFMFTFIVWLIFVLTQE